MRVKYSADQLCSLQAELAAAHMIIRCPEARLS
jgi:hypothetical protein